MKNTTMTLSLLLASSLLLSGCAGPLATIQSKIPFLSKPADAPQGTLSQVVEAGKMSAMIAAGKSGSCTIVNRESGESTELFIKGKKMKFSGVNLGMPEAETAQYPQPTRTKAVSYFLNDGEYTYIWEQGAKNGFKTKLPTEEEIKKMNESLSTTDQTEQLPTDTSKPDLSQFEGSDEYTINCDLKDIADTEFAPPSEVEFMDFSQMTQDWAKSMPTGKEGQSAPGSAGKKLPEGVELPEGMELPQGFEGEMPAEQ